MNDVSIFTRFVIVTSAAILAACSDASSSGGSSANDASDATDAAIDAHSAEADAARGDDASDAAPVAIDGSADAPATPDAGNGSDAGAPLCDPGAVWSAAQLVAVSTDGDDVMPSITPDALTLAWLVVNGGQAGVGTMHYADRAAATQPFGPARIVSGAPYALDGVAVSADGLRVIVVDPSKKSFVEMTRASRGDVFASPGDGTFGEVNAYGRTWLQSNEFFGSPVLAADDLTLYYARYGGVNVDDTLWVTTRAPGASWTLGSKVGEAPFRSVGTQRRRPTGVSADRRTLFFFDETTASERAAWRPALAMPFATFVDLGARSGAQVNGACTRIVYAAAGARSIDLFEATSP